MIYAIISSVIWVVCLVAFNVSLKKRPEKWYTESAAHNKKHKWVSALLGISAPMILMWFAVVVGAKEDAAKEKEIIADTKMREQRYAALDTAILNKIEEIGSYVKETPSFNEMSSRCNVQFLENGIPSQSKLIAFTVDQDGVKNYWIALNETLIENNHYSDSPDSIDYMLCISCKDTTDFYGKGKHVSSTSEMAFIQVFDFKTGVLVDTLHFDTNRNPQSIRTDLKGQKHLYNAIDPNEVITRLFNRERKDI
ncbi:MAG: hypothetical protein J5741_05015 [Bacteroidales bacterium]|nr:hypothetical protein [Bacteroidales bacterium]